MAPGMVPRAAVLALVLLSTLLLADLVFCQTFSYSRGWKNGKRGMHGGALGGALTGGRHPAAAEDQPGDEQPLYRILLEHVGDHRLAPWRTIEDPAPALSYVRSQPRPSALLEQPGAGAGDRED